MRLPPAQASRSRRAQLLLGCVDSKKKLCEPQLNEFVEILRNREVLLVTLETLSTVLNYLESSLIQWHIKRGLPEQYLSKCNLIVMSSEDEGKTKAYKQEIFEFDYDKDGYFSAQAR
eukprot:TRINITY_DN8704_c0_g3_i1.p3 TRINITY_DN8704_c0_g3~~TRINITY_DN8704_c0_g3_i1.p3  ORF type:complete len:117 (-),score=8.98 TRINITY_DN8704_c0_g3_i1:565-915(-)